MANPDDIVVDGDALDLDLLHRHHRIHHQQRNNIPVWAVCHTATSDYPGKFVARMHISLPKPTPSRLVITHSTLEGIRRCLPPGLTRFGRHPEEDPVIVESWL
jgi:hypothetical protein